MKLKERKAGLKKKRIDTDSLQIYSLGVIPLVLVFIFNYLPLGGLVIAFKNYRYDKGILGSEWVGLDNFSMLIKSNDFFKITRNTLCMNAVFIIVGTICAVLLAILLFDLKSRLSTKIYQTILITPTFLSWVVAAYMAYAILHPSYGFLNKILEAMGIGKIDWYSKPNAWPVILTIANVWKNVGMDSVIYYAALMGLDAALFEAAEVEGAKKYQVTWYITIPSLISLITILTILKIGNIFRADFGLFYQLTRNVGALYETTDVIDTYVFRTLRVLGDLGVSSAVGFLQSVVGFILVMLTNFAAKKIDPENALF